MTYVDRCELRETPLPLPQFAFEEESAAPLSRPRGDTFKQQAIRNESPVYDQPIIKQAHEETVVHEKVVSNISTAEM